MRNRDRTTYWRKYQVDVHALDKIDTEGKAYLLGFIAADGYVSRDGLGFTLHNRDVDILEQIKVILGATHPLRPLARSRVALDISSRELAKRLEELGLMSGKTTIMGPPQAIPTELLPHWLRGYWDGDGWLTMRKRASSMVPVVRIAGWSRALMDYVRCLCCEYAGADLTLGAYKGGWSVGMESLNAKRWIEQVYLPASIGGQRKHTLAIRLYNLPDVSLSEAQTKRRRREYEEHYFERNAEMRRLRQEGWLLRQIGEKYGLKLPIVSMICAGKRGTG